MASQELPSGTGHDVSNLVDQEMVNRTESLLEEMKRWAAVSSVSENLEAHLEETGMQIIRSTILPSGLTLVCLRDFEVLPNPEIHDYSDLFNGTNTDEGKISHARHHVDENEAFGHIVWLFELSDRESTSDHTHEQTEVERVLYGKLAVNGKLLSAGQGEIVYPGIRHRGQAIGGTIVLCALIDAAGVNRAEVHKF